MKKIEELRRYFTKGERALWFGSVFVIIAAFYFFDRSNYFTLFASLLGVTSLIFNAKGNPFGQLLMILFSLLYGNHFFHLFLLWRNAYLCRYDYADGGVRSYFLVEKPV